MLRKALNLLSLALILSVNAWAQSKVAPVATPAKPLTYEDFAHANKGCPENSECDETMGQLLGDWKKLAERWEGTLTPTVKEKEMQAQLQKQGWPVEFWVKSQARSGLNPVLYSSSCSDHFAKKDMPTNRIWRGLAFVKGTDLGQVVFTRKNVEFKIKQGELLQLKPVILFPENKTPMTYLIPLDDTPAYVSQGKLHVLVESEGVYALLAIPQDGMWEVKLPPENDLSSYFEDRSDVACPKTAAPLEKPWFQHTHCQKIIDKDSGKPVLAQFFTNC